MDKQSQQEYEVSRHKAVFLLYADDSGWPEGVGFYVRVVIPREKTKLEQVFDDYHSL